MYEQSVGQRGMVTRAVDGLSTFVGRTGPTYFGAPPVRTAPAWQIKFVKPRLPNPGGSAYVYDFLGLIEFPIIGKGVANMLQFRSIQPQPAEPVQTVLPVGYGGWLHGQMALQALMPNPYSSNDPLL